MSRFMLFGSVFAGSALNMSRIQALSQSDKSLLVASYAVSDIYDIAWALLKFAKERKCKNIYIFVNAHEGQVEVRDDGDALNLIELRDSSIFIKSNTQKDGNIELLDLRSLASFRVATRQKLSPSAEELSDGGVITKVKPEGGYRNAILISGIYKHQPLRERKAIESVNLFVDQLKAVMAVQTEINWIFKCQPKNISLMVSGKFIRDRCLNIYKQMVVIDGITVSSTKKWTRPCVYLLDGFPSDRPERKADKDVIFVNELRGNFRMKHNDELPKFKAERSYSRMVNVKSSSASAILKGFRSDPSNLKSENGNIKFTPDRRFLSNLKIIGQFDKKCIVAKEECNNETRLWLFDQHACHERINLERLLADGNLPREEANMKACKSSVRFGDALNLNLQNEIIQDLATCKEPFHCAHGRPTCWLLATLRKS